MRQERDGGRARDGPTSKSSCRSKPGVLHVLPSPFFLPQFTPSFSPTVVVLGPLSLRLRLSRILTVMRSRIISVIIAQPDVVSVAYILSMYNQWFLLFSSLLRMILLCFRRSRNFVAAPTGSSGSRRICNLCACGFSKYLLKVVKRDTHSLFTLSFVSAHSRVSYS